MAPIPSNTVILTWRYDIDNYPLEAYIREIKDLNFFSLFTDYRISMRDPYQKQQRASTLEGSIRSDTIAQKGDRFFLYLTSKNPSFINRIVGSGFLHNNPTYVPNKWSAPESKDAFTVKLDFDVMLNPKNIYRMLTQDVLELQFPFYDWGSKNIDFVLDPHTACLLENKWYKYLKTLCLKCEGDKFWCRSKEGFESMYTWMCEDGLADYGRAEAYLTELDNLFK